MVHRKYHEYKDNVLVRPLKCNWDFYRIYFMLLTVSTDFTVSATEAIQTQTHPAIHNHCTCTTTLTSDPVTFWLKINNIDLEDVFRSLLTYPSFSKGVGMMIY